MDQDQVMDIVECVVYSFSLDDIILSLDVVQEISQSLSEKEKVYRRDCYDKQRNR